jgi:selenophosphate synthetase-related protein
VFKLLILFACEGVFAGHDLCSPLWLQGVGSAINKLNDVVAMIAEVRSIAEALGTSSRNMSEDLRTVHH